MPRLLWTIICQRAILSAQNTITLVDVLDEVQLPVAPPKELLAPRKPRLMIPMKFAVVSLWERGGSREAGRTEARLRMLSPTGKKFVEARYVIELSATQRFRSLSEAAGVPYYGPGNYTMRVDVRSGKHWRHAGSASFALQVQTQRDPKKTH